MALYVRFLCLYVYQSILKLQNKFYVSNPLDQQVSMIIRNTFWLVLFAFSRCFVCYLWCVCVWGGAVWSRSSLSPTQAFYSSSLSYTPSPQGTCFSVVARFDFFSPLLFHSTHRYPGCNGERKVSVILNAHWCHLLFLSVDSKSSGSILWYCSQEGHGFLGIILSFIFSFKTPTCLVFFCLLSSLFIPLSLSLSSSLSLFLSHSVERRYCTKRPRCVRGQSVIT